MHQDRPYISVIIPVWNDAAELRGLLADVSLAPAVEILVVAAEPVDATLRSLEAARPDVAWLSAPKGRARQMNAGAQRAHGEWLLFLHADTRLAPGWADELRALESWPGMSGGSFRFVLRSRVWAARAIEAGVRARTVWLNLPYGDQALFVRRGVFEVLGGYGDLPLMEDIDLVRRLRRRGHRLWHSRLAASSSARRWEQDGWVTRSVSNVVLAMLFLVGVAPARLARAYRHGLRTLVERDGPREYETGSRQSNRTEVPPHTGAPVRRTVTNGEGAC